MIDIKNSRFKLWFMVERKKGPGYKVLRSRPIKAKTLTDMHKEINGHSCHIGDQVADTVIMVRCNPGSSETYFIGTVFRCPKQQSLSMARLTEMLTIAGRHLTNED